MDSRAAWDLYWHADRIASCFDGAGGSNYDERLAGRWRAFFESLPRGSRILDLCTGNGAIAAIAAESGAAAGKDLRAVYAETYQRLKPKYGHWVIFDHCMPFDVSRCYDEVTQHADPRIWTAERDQQMWQSLEG